MEEMAGEIVNGHIEMQHGLTILCLPRWNRDWIAMYFELAQDRGSWAAAFRDVVKATEETSTTIPAESFYFLIEAPFFTLSVLQATKPKPERIASE